MVGKMVEKALAIPTTRKGGKGVGKKLGSNKKRVTAFAITL
jgi:hypothetical protein